MVLFGYYIKDGKVFIDEPAAEKIRLLYKSYLSGLTLENAAKEAGIKAYHGSARHIMQTRHYLGDDFYPAIIDVDTFAKTAQEMDRRKIKLGRTNRIKPAPVRKAPVNFHLGEVKDYYDDPAAQAEYLYSLIESEEN